MNERNKKTFTIVALAVAILLIGVGYAYLQQNLVINGTANIKEASWKVEITNITNTALNGATLTELENDATNPSFTATSATFAVDLTVPGAYAEFDVTIKNNGSINALLNSISGVDTANAATPTQIQFEVTGVTAGTTTLNANQTNTAHVKVWWEGDTLLEEDASKTATITLNYVQNPLPTTTTD